MRPLVFTMQFEGQVAPVEGSAGKLRARTFAHGQTLRTTLTAEAVESALESTAGASATFESEVEMTGDGLFVESGSISYGTAGSLRFGTVGQGVLGPSGIDGLQRGAVIWEVTGGEGQFAGAAGLITSNFTVGADGAVVDNHVACLFTQSTRRKEHDAMGPEESCLRRARSSSEEAS